MKLILPSILYFLLLTSALLSQKELILDKNWMFKESGQDQWRPCKIPGNSFTALLENKLIPDPFFADNEKKVQWVSKQDWLFRTNFEIDSSMLYEDHIQLECPGLDTYCKLFINDIFIGEANNAFRNWSYDIKQFLKPGSNQLLLQFQSDEIISDKLYSNSELKLPGESRVTIRKPQYQFGWDFGPRLINSGISESITLKAWSSIQLNDASVHTISIHDTIAELKLVAHIFLQDTQSGVYKIQFTFGDRDFIFMIPLKYGQQSIKRYFSFTNPRLWWPNGEGDPNLYLTSLRIFRNDQLVIEKKWKSGIRTIELHREKDPLGQTFYFTVNDKKIFCKGSNYIPQNILHPKSDYNQQIIQSAVDCNFNMLRVWGGGQYETDSFYNACDEHGIMIWQDFMYACAMYPGDTAFLENAKTEAIEQVRRLSKHACIALWCGNNESNEGWKRWGWQDDFNTKQREKIWNDYLNLFDKILPEIVDRYSNQTSYWSSSPLYGRGDHRFVGNGDAHDWGLWHDELPFETLEKRVPRFMSEFGFQSWPSIKSVVQFTDPNDLNPESNSLSNHQKHVRGSRIIRDYINRDFPKPDSLKSLIYLNQVMQAEGISKIIRTHRMAKPYCMGSLYWQFNDCWPGVSWSGIDHNGRWKALQHELKNAFEPVLFSAKINKDEIVIYAISDLLKSVNASCEIKFQDFEGKPIFYEHWEGEIPENSSSIIYSRRIKLNTLDLYNSHYVLITWKYNNRDYSKAFLLGNSYKNLKLSDPHISIAESKRTEHGFELKIKGNSFAKNVFLDYDGDLEFFPNYFDINPGETIVVNCITNDPIFDTEKFHFLSMYNFIK